jgi:FkbM family methyltransferase
MNFVAAAARMIYASGLRRSRFGRYLIVRLNAGANFLARLLYVGERKHATVDGHRLVLGDRRIPSLAFLNHCVNGTYEPETSAFMRSLIKEGMIVFDVGAHVGYYTLLAAERVGSTGHIYAFEPEPENFKLLVKNVESNGFRNVTCVNMAVSDGSGVTTFYVNREGSDLHSLVNHSSDRGGAEIQIRTVSLDEFASSVPLKTVDAVKMDIEGTEALALAGMSRLLSQSPSLSIVFEFAPALIRNCGRDPIDVLEDLLDRGIRVSAIDGVLRAQIVTQLDVKAAVLEAERCGAINLLGRKEATDTA